jgi:hypothetical protein
VVADRLGQQVRPEILCVLAAADSVEVVGDELAQPRAFICTVLTFKAAFARAIHLSVAQIAQRGKGNPGLDEHPSLPPKRKPHQQTTSLGFQAGA